MLNTKEDITRLVNDLTQKGVLEAVEKNKFLSLLESGDIQAAKAQLYATLQEKLVDIDTQIIDASLDYATAVREIAEKSGAEELVKMADELDDSIKTGFEIFDEEMDAISEEYQELSPLLHEIDKEAEAAE